MITKTEWAAAVLYCKSLAGLRDAPSKEYLEALYGEIKGLFTKAEIEQAARQIAMNEDLFGQFPPIKLWLQYCPAYQQSQASAYSERAAFMDLLQEWATCDQFTFKVIESDLTKEIARAGGNIGKKALACAGYSLGGLRLYGKSEPALCGALRAISAQWDRLAKKISDKILLDAKKVVAIPEK